LDPTVATAQASDLDPPAPEPPPPSATAPAPLPEAPRGPALPDRCKLAAWQRAGWRSHHVTKATSQPTRATPALTTPAQAFAGSTSWKINMTANGADPANHTSNPAQNARPSKRSPRQPGCTSRILPQHRPRADESNTGPAQRWTKVTVPTSAQGDAERHMITGLIYRGKMRQLSPADVEGLGGSGRRLMRLSEINPLLGVNRHVLDVTRLLDGGATSW
jgi:hypothetical protein